MQDAHAGQSGKSTIIREKSPALGRKSRNKLKGIGCLNSCCSPELCRRAQMVARYVSHCDSTAACEDRFITCSEQVVS